MDRIERDKICKSCTNHKIDDRYGIICGLTDNFANFVNECNYYSKSNTVVAIHNTTKAKPFKRKKKKSYGSLIGGGIFFWIILKLLFKFIRMLSE